MTIQAEVTARIRMRHHPARKWRRITVLQLGQSGTVFSQLNERTVPARRMKTSSQLEVFRTSLR